MKKVLLLSSLGLFVIGDVVTTIILTHMLGASAEGNPIVRFAMQNYGSFSFIFVKLTALLIVIPLISMLPEKLQNIQLGIVTLFGAFGTFGNLYVLHSLLS